MENREIVTKAISYINKTYKEKDICIDDIAANAGFSTDYFNHIFCAHTGFNVMEYLRFKRIKHAAKKLRYTEKSILDIALDCGYEAHESFSRAFKNRYGMSPSEYRRKYEKAEGGYGVFRNETVGARLLYEFKKFKTADTDEVIDYLLEQDALRYGYIAACLYNDGGVALYSGESFRDGFILFHEQEEQFEKFEGNIICDDWKTICEYMKTFLDPRFKLVFYTLEDDDTISKNLQKYGVSDLAFKRSFINVYTGEPYCIVAPLGITMRKLHYSDYDILKKHFYEVGRNFPVRLNGMKRELYRRDVLGYSENSAFIFGIFKGDRLIGHCEGALLPVHGFVVNDCVSTWILDEFKSEELYEPPQFVRTVQKSTLW
ncbi:MAG: helix-turn-helix transcriptional regulator [Clostridia bacterium]|nr:helix-turn-helix transcriptional regulator [Clostridia bacterium]